MESVKEFSVMILGDKYIVKYGSREALQLKFNNIGECRVYEKKILICTDLEDCKEEELIERVKEVTAHEVLHAYFNSSGLELSSVAPECVEEVLCSFYQKHFLKIHKTVMDCLTKVEICP